LYLFVFPRWQRPKGSIQAEHVYCEREIPTSGLDPFPFLQVIVFQRLLRHETTLADLVPSLLPAMGIYHL
jgi:hypothetical protein